MRPEVGQSEHFSRLSRRFHAAYAVDPGTANVHTLYKRKGVKVLPKNVSKLSGEGPGGRARWKEAVLEEESRMLQNRAPSKWDEWFIPRFSERKVGTRLTPERREAILCGPELTPQEREALLVVLENREMALSWEFSEIGRIRPEIAPPQKIETVPHTPWQAANFPVPKALQPIVAEMIRDRLKTGILEHCNGPYRNPWFLVKKDNGKYRLINAAMHINKVTIKDANMPPSADAFAEEFAGMQIGSYIDLFSGYDQVPLEENSRDMTAIQTPFGLLRQTTLLQGATNSVAQFVRVLYRILEEQFPHVAQPYLDDIAVKGTRDRYNDEEVPGFPGCRRFVMEHLRNLDRTLADLERAGVTIAGGKSKFCMAGLKIVGYVCDSDGRHPTSEKIEVILDWPDCQNVTEARAFLGVCVYYRIWVRGFSLIAAPIFRLFRKDEEFYWGREQRKAMDKLKVALTSAPALMPIDYSEGAGTIFCSTDASLDGWGGHLSQDDSEGRRHPARYESGVWSESERKYDAGKRECRALLKTLKKFKNYLYGIRFVVEIDAKTLVAQLNRSASDLPGALVTRWLAWIHLFDFDVRHVPGKKHLVADGLSRRPGRVDSEEEDVDAFVDSELDLVRVVPARISISRPHTALLFPMRAEREGDSEEEEEKRGEHAEEERLDVPRYDEIGDEEEEEWEDSEEEPLREGYTEESVKIARWLKTLRRPSELTTREFMKFKTHALKFMVHRGHLFRKASKNVPLRRVVDNPEDRGKIMAALHEDCGHRGREGTYRRVADRYWWNDMSKEIAAYCKSCPACQFRAPDREDEALHPTWVSMLWQKVGVDLVMMPAVGRYKYLVLARCDLSGWVEGEPLTTSSSKVVAKFLWRCIICRFGCFDRLLTDGGPEFQDVVRELASKYGIKKVSTSPYHPQGNGRIERGHRSIKDALSKLKIEKRGNWVQNLPAVLWADRVTVQSSTGVTPYRLVYGYDPVLPIEQEIPSWSFLSWAEVRSRSELLAMRGLQLQRRDEDLEEIRLRQRRKREENKEAFDDRRKVRTTLIQAGDLVLLHKSAKVTDLTRENKFAARWSGPFRVKEANHLKGNYKLEELDGTEFKGVIAGARLKKFYVRDSGEVPVIENEAVLGEEIEETEVDEEDVWQGQGENESVEDSEGPAGEEPDSYDGSRMERGEPEVVVPRRSAVWDK